MTTKRYLEQIIRIDKLIRNKQAEYNRIRSSLGLSAINVDNERVQTSNIGDPTGRVGAELGCLTKQIEKWQKKRMAIINQIDQIDDIEVYEVLTQRYVNNMSVFEMMDYFQITDRQVYRKINNAHEIFESKYGKTYLNVAGCQ